MWSLSNHRTIHTLSNRRADVESTKLETLTPQHKFIDRAIKYPFGGQTCPVDY